MDKEQQKHLVAVEMALLALGMPPNLKGFYYIKDAVWMLLQSGGHIGNKHIFERLTSRYGAPNSAIRKSMRTAIKVTFDRGNSKSKAKWFGSLLNVEREYPLISVFIATIAAQLRCQMFCMEEEAVKCTLEKRF